MAVYRRHYQPYTGATTPVRLRFLVVLRYAIAELLTSRALVAFLFIAVVPLLVELATVYLLHNPAARALLGLMKLSDFVKLDAEFFLQALSTHCFFGFILAAWIGPGLVAADLSNGALPLYLSRPFSRVDYVLGKALVLVLSTSLITWVPCLLLYFVNGALAETGWWFAHLRIALAFIAGGLAWTAVVTLLALAISAWIRWRLAASAMLFGLYFVSSGIGEAVAAALGTPWGRLCHLGYLFNLTWARMFGAPRSEPGIPLFAAWTVLFLVCIASLGILRRRLVAREVAR